MEHTNRQINLFLLGRHEGGRRDNGDLGEHQGETYVRVNGHQSMPHTLQTVKAA